MSLHLSLCQEREDLREIPPEELFQGDKIHPIGLEDVKGYTVTLDYGGLASDLDKFAPEAQKVVDSVKWGAS